MSLDDLKRLVVELLLRVAAQEDEIRALPEENAHLKSLSKRPKLAPGGMDKATEPDKRAKVTAARSARLAPGRARHRGANSHGGGAAGLAPQGL